MKHVLLSWSSGKDSAWALHLLRQQPDIELVGLLTTLNIEGLIKTSRPVSTPHLLRNRKPCSRALLEPAAKLVATLIDDSLHLRYK